MSNTAWKICIILIIMLSVKIQIKSSASQKYKLKSQSIKTQCTVFSIFRTLHGIESAMESAIKTNTEWAKQLWYINPISKQCRIALILIIANKLLILVILVATNSSIVANFLTYKRVLIKWYYTSKDHAYC